MGNGSMRRGSGGTSRWLIDVGASNRCQAPEQGRLGLGGQAVAFRHLDDVATGDRCVPPFRAPSTLIPRRCLGVDSFAFEGERFPLQSQFTPGSINEQSYVRPHGVGYNERGLSQST